MLAKAKTNFYFPRHGLKYSILPHLIDYQANLAALIKLGVNFILATSRKCAFCKKGEMKFVDMTEPYSEYLRGKLMEAAKKLKIKLHEKAVYACAEGPRFETKAEIVAFERLGAQVVGMTNVPEVVADEFTDIVKQKTQAVSRIISQLIKIL